MGVSANKQCNNNFIKITVIYIYEEKSYFLRLEMVFPNNHQYYKIFNNRRKLADTLVFLVLTWQWKFSFFAVSAINIDTILYGE